MKNKPEVAVKKSVGRPAKGKEPRTGISVSTTTKTMQAVRRHFKDPHEALTLAVKYYKQMREFEKNAVKNE